MKDYQVQVSMSYFVWVDVQAETYEQAQDKALRQCWREQANGNGVWTEEPRIEAVIEGKAE